MADDDQNAGTPANVGPADVEAAKNPMLNPGGFPRAKVARTIITDAEPEVLPPPEVSEKTKEEMALGRHKVAEHSRRQAPADTVIE